MRHNCETIFQNIFWTTDVRTGQNITETVLLFHTDNIIVFKKLQMLCSTGEWHWIAAFFITAQA